jgi:hypothetical protein
MLSESHVLLLVSRVRDIDDPSRSCVQKNTYHNDKDLISEKRAQQFQKNAYHNDKCVISEPASNSLQPAVTKNTFSMDAPSRRGKATAYDHPGPARS